MINWNFIQEQEGTKITPAYVPKTTNDLSGVTIPGGFDLGSKTEETLRDKLNLSPDLINTLRPYLGLQGQAARDVAGNLILEKSQIEEINKANKILFTNEFTNYYNSNTGKDFNNLDDSVQTVAASVGYQYGVDLKNKTPNFWNYLTQENYDGLVSELRNFQDEFPSRRNREADYLSTEIKKKIPNYEFVDLWGKQEEKGGELFLDQLFKTYQNQSYNINNPRNIGTLEAIGAAVQKNHFLPMLYRTMVAESFEPTENFSMKNNKDFFEKLYSDYNIQDQFKDYFIGAVSEEHATSLAKRVVQEQDNVAILNSLGYKGLFIDLASWMLDPVTLGTGIGITSKLVRVNALVPGLTRVQAFKRGGLIIGAEQGLYTIPLAAESPSLNVNDVLIAATLGGTLGGGITSLLHGKLQRIAQEAFDDTLKTAKFKKTPNGEREIPSYKDDAEFIKTFNDTYFSPDKIDNIESAGKGWRNWLTLGLIPATRHASLDGSNVANVRSVGARLVENPTFFITKGKGKPSDRVVPSPRTAETEKVLVLNTAQRLVAPEVNNAFTEWVKVNGSKIGKGKAGQLFDFNARATFSHKVFKAINALNPSNKNEADKLLLQDPHIRRAAEAYAKGFNYTGNQVKAAGIEGSEKIVTEIKSKGADGKEISEQVKWYVPQIWAFENYIASSNRVGASGKIIGREGIIQLIKGAILSKQPYLAKQSDLATLIGQKDVKPNFVELNKVNQVVKLEEIKTLKEKLKLEKEFLKKEKENLVVDINGDIVVDRQVYRKENIKTLQEQIKKLDTEVKESQVKLEKDFIAKGEKEVIADITPERATVMAEAIVKFLEHSYKGGKGFDLAQLLKIKDVSDLRVYLEREFPEISSVAREKLVSDLGSSLDFVTSGRLEERIKLNSNYETVIDGVTLRLDDLLNKNVDILWNRYINEMSGNIGLAKVLNLKSKNDWIRLRDQLNSDIDLDLRSKPQVGIKGWLAKTKANEEKKTLDSIYEHLMGRSGEEDLSNGWSEALRNLRAFNFMRVLGQVGLSSLPDLGAAVATNGLKTFANNIPELGTIFREARIKNRNNIALNKDLSVLSSNGDEWAWNMSGGQEMLDGNTALTHVSAGGAFRKVGEKLTALASLQIPIDTTLRKMALKLYVDKFASDMFKVKNANFDLSVLGKADLNRYKVLGLDDNQMLALAREFTSPSVTVEKAAYGGYKVKSFNWANFQDKGLLNFFSIAADRHIKRAVQYNFIGDSNRFFSDNALGKTLGQFRSFMMVAWNKQLNYNVQMGDFKTFSIFGLSTMMAGITYVAHTNLNAVGMSAEQKQKYFDKRFGDSEDKFWRKVGMAAFQRAGFSSALPSYMDLLLQATAPDWRFNTRTSGLEVNLITGNPTYNFGSDLITAGGSILKALGRDDYDFSQVDAKRIAGLPMFKTFFGYQNLMNFLIGRSGLPETGGR